MRGARVRFAGYRGRTNKNGWARVKGTLELPGSPLRFDDNAFSGGRSRHTAPPSLGQHNESIRAELED